jgi:uncharacterized membrane protein YjgN (DUF898 family)
VVHVSHTSGPNAHRRQPSITGEAGSADMFALAKVAILLVFIGWVAAMSIDFNERYLTHRHIREQYDLLAKSDLCVDPRHRVATRDVNNCDRAERYFRGEELSPAASAALEAMTDLAICGRHGARCEYVFHVIAESSCAVIAMGIAFFLAMTWVLLQKRGIEQAYATELPLSSAKYPHRVPFYIAQKQD